MNSRLDELFNDIIHISLQWIYRSAKIVWTKTSWVYSSSLHKWGRNKRRRLFEMPLFKFANLMVINCCSEFEKFEAYWRRVFFLEFSPCLFLTGIETSARRQKHLNPYHTTLYTRSYNSALLTNRWCWSALHKLKLVLQPKPTRRSSAIRPKLFG